MPTLLLQLSLCAVTVIQLTSSQSTFDVAYQENGAGSCGGIGQIKHVLHQLAKAVSQLQRDVNEMKTNMSQLNSDVTKVPRECPADFTNISSVNGCYKVVNRNLEWAVAGLECRSLHRDAHLVVIDNVQEQAAVAGMLASIASTSTTLTKCYTSATWGTYFWTAGQRIDPSRESTFVWRVTSTDTYSDTLSTMAYTNWDTDRPNYVSQEQACMHLWAGGSYKWNDNLCTRPFCSLCELNL